MEITESQTARMLTNCKTDKAFVESNNGGKGFSRNVESLMRESGNTHTQVEWFHQGENKMARILSASTNVTNCIIWPKGWQDIWPQVYHDLTNASRTRKMVHDDLEDGLSGVVEKIISPEKTFIIM
jgi:predicted phage terminase large subunit-like protein